MLTEDLAEELAQSRVWIYTGAGAEEGKEELFDVHLQRIVGICLVGRGRGNAWDEAEFHKVAVSLMEPLEVFDR
jgi:hypothetical protein